MNRLLRMMLWVFGSGIVWLRYRVRVHGREQLRGLKGRVLILPNHPGYIDPLIVMTSLGPHLRPRPLVFNGTFTNPVLYPFMKILNAVEVPDLDRPSSQAREQAQAAVREVIEGLQKGENHIFWPSGRLQRDGVERLGGAQAVSDVLSAVPDAEVILVRTRGVWGSMFSFAQTGKLPDLVRCQRLSLRRLLASLLLFMPRREIHITVERLDRSKLPGLTREKLNPWLEAWYNADGPEKPTYVPYHFLFGPRTFEYPEYAGLARVDPSLIKAETRKAVGELLSEKLGRTLTDAELNPDTMLDQLGLDSLGRMDAALTAEQRFGFSGDQAPQTVGQLCALAQGLVEKEPPKPPPPAWFQKPSSDGPLHIDGATIPEAFVNRALACRKDPAVADDMAGVLSYERLLVGALVLARRFVKLPGEHVGLMLPASAGCDLALLGLQLAGKVPVLLNWTTGPANLAHAARSMGLTHVVTSANFKDRLHITIEGTEYLYLEDLNKSIRRSEALGLLLRARYRPGAIRRAIPRPSPDAPAVVLFTSGSEKAPKAVPLTHRNLLSNQQAAIDFLGPTRQDAILGFLPVFHSFGLSVTTLMPLLGGMRVVHHPDPTNAAGLTRKIAGYRPTILAGTPTFVSYIFERGEPADLASLRLIVVGAEKCPEALFERVRQKAPTAHLLEGYGITECAPMVSANRPGASRVGTIGQPLPGVEARVVELDGDAILADRVQPTGRMGMLLVHGPNIFPGYLNHDGPPPFVESGGKRWYVTGDLAEIDGDGFIHFRGRLKRFLKAGGEMISLPALEEPFTRRFPPTQDGPRVAVEGVEIPGGRRIVLFCTEPLTLREANAMLEAEGMRGVMRLDEVRQVEAIPVLGTGKTDYKVLRARLMEGMAKT